MGEDKKQFTRKRSGRSARDNRKFMAAVMWIGRTGAQRRALHTEYGKWSNKRFVRWANDFLAVDDMVDSTIIRALSVCSPGRHCCIANEF